MTEAVAERQRIVREVGKKLEANVWQILNKLLNKKEIYAFNVAEIKRWSAKDPRMRKLIEYVKVVVKNPCSQDHMTTLPDTDTLVVFKQEDAITGKINWHPLCIISCKTSFHARETEALFWAIVARPSKINYVLVTEDSDRYNVEAKKRKTELGTCVEGNRTRRLLESFLDRVYIIKKYGAENNDIVKDINNFHSVFERAEASSYRGVESRIFDDYQRKPHAGCCSMVRPFDDLLFDIMKWKYEKLG